MGRPLLCDGKPIAIPILRPGLLLALIPGQQENVWLSEIHLPVKQYLTQQWLFVRYRTYKAYSR
jgi:hypothetical protein